MTAKAVKTNEQDNRLTNDNITVWGSPTEMLSSQYGYIDYAEWCNYEVKRFASHGHAVKIVEKNGHIALARA